MMNRTPDGLKNLAVYCKLKRTSLNFFSVFNCIIGVLSLVTSKQIHFMSKATSLSTLIFAIVTGLFGPILYLTTGILSFIVSYKQTKRLVIATVILSAFCAYFALLTSVVSLASVHLECSGVTESPMSCIGPFIGQSLNDIAALLINLTVVTLIGSALLKSRTKMFFLVPELMENRLAKIWDIEEIRDQREQPPTQEESPQESDESPPSYSMITVRN